MDVKKGKENSDSDQLPVNLTGIITTESFQFQDRFLPFKQSFRCKKKNIRRFFYPLASSVSNFTLFITNKKNYWIDYQFNSAVFNNPAQIPIKLMADWMNQTGNIRLETKPGRFS